MRYRYVLHGYHNKEEHLVLAIYFQEQDNAKLEFIMPNINKGGEWEVNIKLAHKLVGRFHKIQYLPLHLDYFIGAVQSGQ